MNDVVWFSILLIAIFSAGCRQTTFSNPFGGEVPAYKTAYGPTPVEKISMLQTMAKQFSDMGPAELQQKSNDLMATFVNEKDVLLRCELVRTMSALPTNLAAPGLQAAMRDADPTVVQTACWAWGSHPCPDGEAALHALLNGESADTNTRLSAIHALSHARTPTVLRILSEHLEDRDPAIQIAAMEALRTASGKELGNDINQWKSFVTAAIPAHVAVPTTTNPPMGSPPPSVYPNIANSLDSAWR